jgi:hypothetical protein
MGNTKGSTVRPGGSQEPRECISALQVHLKPTITYGKGEPDDSHPILIQ